MSGTTHLPVRISVDRVELQRVQPRVPGHFDRTRLHVRRLPIPRLDMQSDSGDYNADGNNLDYPDATSYSQSTDNKAWLTGAIPKTNFAVPTFGREGNEKPTAVPRTELL